ncbi:unnamed protein product [Blepharisma stoltei]|uniref:EF-hand domain-containing protein n=1 Tax=Blepharisma stoltei TaxID=1481888 RepID=A0AAU9KHR5_9CILI|nr:unnamed protein product [Blepharisma stoltei]
MGGVGSQLRREEVEELMRKSKFNQKELKRIYRRFARLDHEEKGWVSVDDILTLPELTNHPMRDRIARMMTIDMGEVIDFKLFVETISLFSDRLNPEEKLRYFFKLYDMDGDGFVGEGELFVMLRILVGGSLNDAQVQSIVDQVIQQTDRDKDGKLNFKEFKDMLGETQESFNTKNSNY